MARPTKFDDKLKPVMMNLAKQGKTLKQIAHILGVHESTIYNWYDRAPKFFESLKEECLNVADREVELSLYNRANGYSCEETKVFLDKKGKVVEHKVLKHYPPDPTSMIFWLKNRQPDKWKDKRDIDLGNQGDVAFQLSYSTEKEPND